jgi:hypothetical protein
VVVVANDGWNEQVVKRGWTAHGLPSVITPSLSWGWAVLLAATAVVFALAYRVRPARAVAG